MRDDFIPATVVYIGSRLRHVKDLNGRYAVI